MTDEEKKAIESFKEENNNDLSRFDDFNSYTQFKVKRDKLIIDLIEKQSKEIEELTDKNKKLKDKAKELIFEKQELTSGLLDSTPNDKIKAKIEEVEQWELYNMKISRLSTLDERLGAKIGIKYVLQSLLEEE